jgi:Double zinc ribbon
MAARSSPRRPRCQHENPPGARFCVGCGSRLGAQCAACGAGLPDGARFCPGCGRAVDAPATADTRSAPESYTPRHLAEKILTSRSAMEGERKPVTVLFCDLVNSTALAERLGPDHMHAPRLILDKAEGNPFFLEELARVVGDQVGSGFQVPDTVHGGPDGPNRPVGRRSQADCSDGFGIGARIFLAAPSGGGG